MIGSNGTPNEHVYPNIVEGTVEARNDRGIRINGDWFNASQFRPVTLPDVGQLVRLKVQPKGFINSLEIIQPATAAPSERDTRISRLAVLKAAASFAATRQDIKSGDVLKIADAWLAWVER